MYNPCVIKEYQHTDKHEKVMVIYDITFEETFDDWSKLFTEAIYQWGHFHVIIGYIFRP